MEKEEDRGMFVGGESQERREKKIFVSWVGEPRNPTSTEKVVSSILGRYLTTLWRLDLGGSGEITTESGVKKSVLHKFFRTR